MGVKKFVDRHPRFGKMKVALFSQCMGGISQYVAISRHPELFANVLCMLPYLKRKMVDELETTPQTAPAARPGSFWDTWSAPG